MFNEDEGIALDSPVTQFHDYQYFVSIPFGCKSTASTFEILQHPFLMNGRGMDEEERGGAQ